MHSLRLTLGFLPKNNWNIWSINDFFDMLKFKDSVQLNRQNKSILEFQEN